MEKIREAMELALKEHWSQPSEGEGSDAMSPAQPLAPVRAVAAARAGTARAGQAAAAATAPAHPPRRAPIPQRTTPLPQRAPESAPSALLSSARCTLSHEKLLANRLVAALADHPAREAYCLLQAAVIERSAGNDTPWIGVTRPRSGRGKTLTAANLAISLAADGRHSVLLIDLDLRRPGMHALFELEAGKSLEDCLFARALLEEALVPGPVDGLTLLPARKASGSAEQIFTSPNLKKLLGELKARFPRHVAVIDLPVLDGGPESAALKTLVDGVVIVVEDGVSRESDYRRTLTSVGKAKLIGTALNRAASA